MNNIPNSILKETIQNLLEELTPFPEGTNVNTPKGPGVIRLSKFPYYAIQLQKNGITQTFHNREVKEDLGKYDINESENEDIIILSGVLIVNTQERNLGDILSDIRSISGVTIVRNDNVYNNREHNNESYKTQLHIKIDPYPFKDESVDSIKQYVSREISKLNSVRNFQKITQDLTVKNTVNKIQSPVKSMDDLREVIKFRISEIKVNNPATKGKQGAINYLKLINKLIGDLYPEILQAYNDGRLSQQLADKISSSFNLINKRFGLEDNEDWFVEWVNKYVEDIGLPIKSSGSFFTGLVDIDGYTSEFISKGLEVDEDDLYELAKIYLKNYGIHWR